MSARLTVFPDKYIDGWNGWKDDEDTGDPPAYPVVEAVAALSQEYRTDYHFAPYYLVTDTGPLDVCPRLNRACPPAIEPRGLQIRFACAPADIDCPDVHDGRLSEAPGEWRADAWAMAARACPDALIYDTKGGIRLIVGLPVEMNIADYLRWSARFRNHLRAHGLEPDEITFWGQLYRGIYGVREGKQQRRRAEIRALVPLILPEEKPKAQGGRWAGIEDVGVPFTLPEKIATGERHGVLVQYAGLLANQGGNFDALLAALLDADRTRCEDPLSETEAGLHEITEIAQHATRWAEVAEQEKQERQQAVERARPAGPAAHPPAPPPNAPAARPPQVLDLASHVELARSIGNRLEDGTVELVHDRAILWRYNPPRGVWENVTHTQVKRMVSEYDGLMMMGGGAGGRPARVKVSAGLRRDVDEVLRSERDIAGWVDAAPSGVALANCWVGIVNGTTDLVKQDHHPDQRATVGYEFEWTTEPPHGFLDLLNDCWLEQPDRDAMVQLLGEFVGLCLLGKATLMQKAITFVGTGSNGKSTVQLVVVGLFPPGAITSVAPQDFGREYHRAMLAGSLLNVISEVSDKEIDASSSAAYKALVTGEPMTARPIREAPFTFRPKGGQLWACNELPEVSGGGEAFFRRQMIFRFCRTFTAQEAKRNLAEQILAAERQKIVCWSLRLAANALLRGHYIEPPSSILEVRTWQEGQDVVTLFLADRATVTGSESGLVTDAATLYNAFSTWAQANGHRVLTSNKFWRRCGALLERVQEGNQRKYAVTLH